MIEVVAEQPIAAGDQLADDAGRVRRSARLGGRLLVVALDLRGKPVAQLGVEGTDERLNAVLPHVGRVRQLLTAQCGDGVAQAEAVQDPIEALARMDALVKGDLHDGLQILILLRLVRLQRLAHGVRLVEHAKIRPRLRQLAFLQEELTNLAAGLADRLFVVGVRAFGKLGGRAGRNRRDAELLALPHEQRVKETGIVLVFAETVAQAAKGGFRPVGAEGAMQFVVDGGIHDACSWPRVRGRAGAKVRERICYQDRRRMASGPSASLEGEEKSGRVDG